MRKILVIKNGNCDTDIKNIINKIDKDIIVDIICSTILTDDICIRDIKNYSSVIILGGHQSLADIDTIKKDYPHIINLIKYTRYWIDSDIKVLGICLGAQIMAYSLGYIIRHLGHNESGYHKNIFMNESSDNYSDDDFINSDIQSRFKYFVVNHNDYIDFDTIRPDQHLTINHNIHIMAYMRPVLSNQTVPYIFKIKNSYGLQFHPEITINMLDVLSCSYYFSEETIEFAHQNADAITETSIILIKNWINMA